MTHTLAELDQIVGGMTEQMNDKMDTDGRNGTSEVDYVVEWKVPTSSDPSWYRLYKSGWVEQGGRTTSDGQTVVFTIPMTNTEYFVSGMAKELDTGAISSVAYLNKTATSITLYGKRVNAAGFASGAHPVYWEVKGFAAQT